jgi:hypothetical protein
MNHVTLLYNKSNEGDTDCYDFGGQKGGLGRRQMRHLYYIIRAMRETQIVKILVGKKVALVVAE